MAGVDNTTQTLDHFRVHPDFVDLAGHDEIREALDRLANQASNSGTFANTLYGFLVKTQVTGVYCNRWYYTCLGCSDVVVPPSDNHEIKLTPAVVHYARHSGYSGWILRSYIPSLSWDVPEDWCVHCYENSVSCDECGDRHDRDSDYLCWINDGETPICEPCLDRYYSYCDEHDEYSRYECSYCVEDARNGGGLIHDYGYKPDPEFKVVADEESQWESRKVLDIWNPWRHSRLIPPTPYHFMDPTFYTPRLKSSVAKPMVFMGFELEVESGSNTLADGAALFADSDFMYLKRDGSINHGFEIVSHPMTLRAHKELMDWSFMDKLTELGYRSFRTQTCGLHIHVNRAAFDSDAHLFKFAKLFANHAMQMQRLGGRDSSRWGSFSHLQGNRRIESLVKSSYHERYSALNFNNATTIELRFFKGTLRTKRLHSALELVDAAVEYTRQLDTRMIYHTGGIHFDPFAEWIVDKPQYENLAYFIKTFNLSDTTRLTSDEYETSNEQEV